MRKLLLAFSLSVFFLFSFTSGVKAADCDDASLGISVTNNALRSYQHEEKDSLELQIDTGKMAPGSYYIAVFEENFPLVTGANPIARSNSFDVSQNTATLPTTINSSALFSFNISDPISYNNKKDDKHVYIYTNNAITGNVTSTQFCKLGIYTITFPSLKCSEPIQLYQNRTINGVNKKCYSYNGTGCIEANSPVNVELKNVRTSLGNPWTNALELKIAGLTLLNLPTGDFLRTIDLDSSGNLSWQTQGFTSAGTARISINSGVWSVVNLRVPIEGACTTPSEFVISGRCKDECLETPPTSGIASSTPYKICNQITDTTLQKKCLDCAGATDQGGVWTAIGCISRDPIKITERLIQVGLGIGGGVALIMTLAGGFILSTSQGDPQKANQAKEMITNSVIGLLFVIFSVFILQFIGVTILNIPGFGGS